MTRSLPAITLLLLALSACAPTAPDPGWADATGPFAHATAQPRPVSPVSCPKPSPSLPCTTRAAGVASPALFNAPSQGIYQPPVIPVASAPAPPAQPSVPSLGTPVFGPTGVFGTVINHAGNNAVVAPIGGGAPGLMVPNGNGTATIFVPGGVPTVVATPPVP
jgi:hypothetical protein